MQFIYPAELKRHSDDEIVVSFRDLPECLTSGEDVPEALLEAEDALDAAIYGRLRTGEPIPTPSSPLPGEYMIALPIDMAAKAALTLVFRASGLTQAALAERLGVDRKVVQRMLDPRRRTSVSRLNDAMRAMGNGIVLEAPSLPAGAQGRP